MNILKKLHLVALVSIFVKKVQNFAEKLENDTPAYFLHPWETMQRDRREILHLV